MFEYSLVILNFASVSVVNKLPAILQSLFKNFIICVTLAKAGLVVGPLWPSVCPSVHNT